MRCQHNFLVSSREFSEAIDRNDLKTANQCIKDEEMWRDSGQYYFRIYETTR
jgi:hypothetical protein